MHKELGISKVAERFINKRIRHHSRKKHKKHRQAVAIALNEAREHGYKIPAKKKRMLL